MLEGVGALVGLIGVGTLIAGYLYPNTGKELTDAVDEFEKKFLSRIGLGFLFQK